MNRQVILIGGAPTAGKSFMAQQLSKHLNIPWISTDQIREFMRTTVNEKDFPALFISKEYTAESFLNKFSAEEIVNQEIDEAEATWTGVKWFIEKDDAWENGFIIEGIGILPHLIAKDFKDKKEVKAVFLVDEDVDRVRDVVFNRGVWDDASTYSDDVKEKEVDWVLLFNKLIKTEAEKNGYPVISVNKHNDDFQTLLKALEMRLIIQING